MKLELSLTMDVNESTIAAEFFLHGLLKIDQLILTHIYTHARTYNT